MVTVSLNNIAPFFFVNYCTSVAQIFQFTKITEKNAWGCII